MSVGLMTLEEYAGLDEPDEPDDPPDSVDVEAADSVELPLAPASFTPGPAGLPAPLLDRESVL